MFDIFFWIICGTRYVQYVDRYVFIAIAYMSTWVYKYTDMYLVVTVCLVTGAARGATERLPVRRNQR